MAILKKGINLLSNIGLLALILYALVASPLIVGYHPVVILTGSMSPTYKVGTIVYYKQVEESKLKVGDAITFKNNADATVTHRLNKIEDGLYETKGDANVTPDVEKIAYQNILGKVASVTIPLLGYYICFINNHLYIVAIILLIIIIDFLLEIFNKKGNNKLSNF